MPPSKKQKTEDNKYVPYTKPETNQKRPLMGVGEEMDVDMVDLTKQVDSMVVNPSTSTMSRLPFECSKYLDKTNLETLPFLYQRSELLSKGQLDHVDYYLSKFAVNHRVQQAFQEQSNRAQLDVVSTILREKQNDPRYRDFMPLMEHFYQSMVIYTKSHLRDTLAKGFHWVQTQMTHRRCNGWILMTENYIRTIDDPQFKSKPTIGFKSSEWIGRLFISVVSSTFPCKCILDSTLYHRNNVNTILQEPSNECYVLFDDGAYSGSQKATQLKTFINRVLPLRRRSVLYIVIPYYTVYALDKFNLYILTAEDKVTVEYVVAPSHRYYKVTHTESGHVVEIFVWTNGVMMKETARIIQEGPGNDATKNQFETLIKNIQPIGATLTLFEHKVADWLSVNLTVADLFLEKMKTHYAFNPPYKLKHVGGEGGKKKTGLRGKNK